MSRQSDRSAAQPLSRRTLLTVGFAVATAAAALAADKAPTDDELVDLVRLRLTSDPDVNGGAIQVNAKAGVVTLAGQVRSEKAKKKAEKVAGKVKGVKKVTNELTVNPTV